VFACETFVVPRDNECVISMKLNCLVDNKIGIFSPYKVKLAELGIVCAQSVCNSIGGFIPVRLLNVSDKDKVIYKNTIFGEFEINSISSSNDIAAISKSSNNFDHLKSLIDKIQNNNNLSTEDKKNAKSIIFKYSDIFSRGKFDIGSCDYVKHEIDLAANAPIQQTVSKVPLNVQEWVDKQVDNLRESGVIRESVSPWSAPVVVVKKKSGDYRMCIDYRRLNSITIRPTYSIPDSQTIFNHLSEATIFSSIDVSNAYYQCEIRESDKKLTAFSTRKGHFEFNKMPFGLSGAPFTFQRLMHSVLKTENWIYCLIYLDDVLVFSSNFKQHLERIDVIFSKIRDSGLKLSPNKCNLFLPEVSYLGHIVSSAGLKTDPEKIRALKNWPLPMTVTELRKFLGFANYYRKFIFSFASLTQDLESLLKSSCMGNQKKQNHAPLTWTDSCKISFEKLRTALCNAPCLAYPKSGERYILDTDASFSAIGSVLSQVQDGVERVIAYGSKKLTKSEKNYCVTRKELFSVYFFVNHFKQYLLGSQFKIRTDHKALSWMMNWRKPNTSQYCAWIAELEIYDFEIEHRPGEKHINADFLSRPPEDCQQCELKHVDPKLKRNVKICNQLVDYLSPNDISKFHCNLGHIGVSKLVEYLKTEGYNAKLCDVRSAVGNCVPCLQRKSPGRRINYNLQYTSFNPFERVAIDIAGPLPVTKHNSRYILSILDIFSRFIVIVPLANIQAEVIVKTLKSRWLSYFGAPKEIISDGGANFTGHEMENFCRKYGIKRHITSPYHPSSNGLIERYFRTVKDRLFATSTEDGCDWDECMWKVQLGVQVSKNSSTNATPLSILLGSDSERDRLRRQNTELKEKNATISHKFVVGDRVMVKSVSKKPQLLEKRYDGPCRIVECREYKSYLLDLHGKLIIRHEDFLKPCNTTTESSIYTSINSAQNEHTPTQTRRYPRRTRQTVQRYGFNS